MIGISAREHPAAIGDGVKVTSIGCQTDELNLMFVSRPRDQCLLAQIQRIVTVEQT